jgi:hypothetical protein
MFLLDGIVSEMTIDIGRIIIKLFAASPEVTFLKPINFQVAAYGSNERIAADIEFTIFV